VLDSTGEGVILIIYDNGDERGELIEEGLLVVGPHVERIAFLLRPCQVVLLVVGLDRLLQSGAQEGGWFTFEEEKIIFIADDDETLHGEIRTRGGGYHIG
jgi:hypothetical protein